VRTGPERSRPDRYLGVRLSSEELELLDRYQTRSESPTRSDAVRALVRDAERPAAGGLELPVTTLAKLEEIVADGWVKDLDGAVSLVLGLGLNEFGRLHAERLPRARQVAREAADRRRDRNEIDRKGRGLLGG
jgi:hypothetical protein